MLLEPLDPSIALLLLLLFLLDLAVDLLPDQLRLRHDASDATQVTLVQHSVYYVLADLLLGPALFLVGVDHVKHPLPFITAFSSFLIAHLRVIVYADFWRGGDVLFQESLSWLALAQSQKLWHPSCARLLIVQFLCAHGRHLDLLCRRHLQQIAVTQRHVLEVLHNRLVVLPGIDFGVLDVVPGSLFAPLVSAGAPESISAAVDADQVVLNRGFVARRRDIGVVVGRI